MEADLCVMDRNPETAKAKTVVCQKEDVSFVLDIGNVITSKKRPGFKNNYLVRAIR